MRCEIPWLILMLLLGLPACTTAEVPEPATSPTPAPTATSSPQAYEVCGWQWAEQSLPEVTVDLQAALTAADLVFDSAKTRAYAFGENCLDRAGHVQYFAPMETDFIVATPVDAGDLETLGTVAGDVLRLIVSDFAPGTVPGPQLGQVEFVFLSSGGELHRRVRLSDAEAVLDSSLDGEELYQALFP